MEIHHETLNVSTVQPSISQWRVQSPSSATGLMWRTPLAAPCSDLDVCFLKSQGPKLKSQLKAKSTSLEVGLAVQFQFCCC